jgi:type VI secretion system protein ImpC
MSDWTPDYGHLDTPPPTWAARRPVRIALLGDFGGGAAAGRLDTGAALAKHKPRPVEFDSLEDELARQGLTLALPIGADRSAVSVTLSELESFHPDTLFRELPLFRQLGDLRKRLNSPSTFDKAAAEVAQMTGTKRKVSRLARGARARGAALSASARLDDFARLTGRASAPPGGAGLAALLRDVVGPFIVPAARPEKAPLLAALDAALADGMRAVLHQPDFQTAESLWRGVDFLLRRLETGPMLHVQLIDVSAEEFAADLSAVDDLADSGLHELLVSQPAQARDGGYTYIAGLYQFEATPPHTELLGRMARIAAAAGATFLTSMSVDDLSDARRPPHPLVATALRALQALPEAARLVLLGPRFLLRHPYGKRSDPITAFAFEEFTAADGLSGLLWGHPALLALTVLAGQGGTPVVDDLPFHCFIDTDGDSTALPCTERFLSTAAVSTLAGWGVGALVAHKGEARVRLSGLAGVAAAGTASRADGRSGVQLQVQGRAPERATTARLTDDDSLAPADLASSTDAPPAAADDDLDALLASLGDEPETADPAAGADSDDAMDVDLDELLKSLG